MCACTARPLVVTATPTPETPPYCKLHVAGRWVRDAEGDIVILHGADLPTLGEMKAGAENPDRHLRQLAEAGARVVRLPIAPQEITPTFVPAVISPFIEQANALGMLVILAYRNDVRDSVRNQGNDAEEWLRLMLTYLRNAPGVWLQPFASPIDTPKWRAINQRMVDVVRGFPADNIVVIAHPLWLKTAGAAEVLDGGDVVYAVDAPNGRSRDGGSRDDGSRDDWPLDAAPFIVTGLGGQATDEAIEAVKAARVWSIAEDGAADSAADSTPATALSALWKSSATCH